LASEDRIMNAGGPNVFIVQSLLEMQPLSDEGYANVIEDLNK
jgi:hypothetical protein